MPLVCGLWLCFLDTICRISQTVGELDILCHLVSQSPNILGLLVFQYSRSSNILAFQVAQDPRCPNITIFQKSWCLQCAVSWVSYLAPAYLLPTHTLI